MPAPTDHADGDQFDFTATFVTRRPVAPDAATVHRLVFSTDSDSRLTLLVPESFDCATRDLQTGHEYEVFAVRYCVPPAVVPPSEQSCPDCGDELRSAVAIDSAPDRLRHAADSLGLTDPFVIATERTSIKSVDRDSVDDWTPMGRAEESGRPDIEPHYVCDSCGEVFYERDLYDPVQDDADLHDFRVDTVESAAPQGNAMATQDTVGLATGGSKDTTNFRENIEAGYTPKPGAISTEGLFYDYYFETGGESADTDALFAPQYAAGVSDHPVTGETERYLTVGLDSTLETSAFERPRLDLVAVLDVSGSMDSPFDDYYYDEHGRQREADTTSDSKMEAATRALCALTEQLDDDDRLGVVLFNNRAHVAKPLRDMGTTDMDAIRRHIREVSAGGGTNMEDGFEAAWDLLQDAPAESDTERRVVFMTDMMPNMGSTGTGQLRQQFEDAAADGINTTFVGIGLDENADLADAVSDIRGANHYFVHSVESFEQRLGEEFAYMVSPLVYDLQLEVDSDDCGIVAVHGAPGNDDTEQLLHVTTLFPSPKSDGETRGGVILVELDGAGGTDLDLVASWVERDGSTHSERLTVTLPDECPTYQHTGVRKSVVLARYATAIREWCRDVHTHAETSSGIDDWIGQDAQTDQEQQSVPLTVPETHARQFKTLRAYLVAEADALGDDDLQQEVDLLEQLCAAGDVEIQPTPDRGGGED